jgi:hypothetical protein
MRPPEPEEPCNPIHRIIPAEYIRHCLMNRANTHTRQFGRRCLPFFSTVRFQFVLQTGRICFVENAGVSEVRCREPFFEPLCQNLRKTLYEPLPVIRPCFAALFPFDDQCPIAKYVMLIVRSAVLPTNFLA